MFSNTGGFLSPVGSWVINIGVTFTVLRATHAGIPKENTHTQGNVSIHTNTRGNIRCTVKTVRYSPSVRVPASHVIVWETICQH